MRCCKSLLVLLVLANTSANAQMTQTGFLDRSVSVEGQNFKYQLYVPRNYDQQASWPVILFLHGAGERGSEGTRQTIAGLAPAIRSNPARYPAIVVFPQVPPTSTWTGAAALAALAALEQTEREFNTDKKRVYLTGLSMGGHGSWYLAYRHPERFAALAPICGWVSPRSTMAQADAVVPDDGDHFRALARKLQRLPVWIFHGEMDNSVPVAESRRAAAALLAAGANVRYTELPGIGHNSWDPAYSSDEFVKWLFSQRLQ